MMIFLMLTECPVKDSMTLKFNNINTAIYKKKVFKKVLKMVKGLDSK